MASKKSSSEAPADVPIFLRKTYHMIGTCNPDIACWSDDGETFVVKDPDKFERTIIPQFFKHSKFSSFVRQLNFYSFRKIKYADTIRIDPELEAKTAKYWRFHHEKFQRGKPHLLSEMKRMNSSATTKTTTTASSSTSSKEDKSTKIEVQSLKKRIEEMTKNIDELTAMVQEVSLKQNETEEAGSKRKKVEAPLQDIDMIRPSEMLSSMELEEMAMPLSPMPATSDSDQQSDNEFVDQLFSAFNEEGDDVFFGLGDGQLSEPDIVADNRPDPELMRRLGDALMLLPKETQEMIVDRLIVAITSTDALPSSAAAAAALDDDNVAVAPVVSADNKKQPVPPTTEEQQPSPALPLAAATLAALLHHYSSSQVQGKQSPKNVQKSIPVIPVHA